MISDLSVGDHSNQQERCFYTKGRPKVQKQPQRSIGVFLSIMSCFDHLGDESMKVRDIVEAENEENGLVKVKITSTTVVCFLLDA